MSTIDDPVVSAPAPQSPRTRRLALLIGGGVLVLLVAAGVVAFVLLSASHAPQVTVDRFLSELEAGKASEALATSHTPVTASDVLLTDRVYAKTADRVSGYSVVRETTSGGDAVVEVKVRQKSGSFEQRFRLRQDGTVLLLFPEWVMRPLALGRVDAQVGAPATAEATVAGIPTPIDKGRVSLRALPGAYRVSLVATTYYTGEPDTSTVAGFGGSLSTSAVVNAGLTSAGNKSAMDAIDSYVSACVASSSPTPAGCTILLGNASDFTDYRNVTWTLDSSPKVIVVTTWSIGSDPLTTGWTLETTVPGTVSFSADADYSSGGDAGVVTFDSPEQFTVGGAISDVTASGATYHPSPDGS